MECNHCVAERTWTKVGAIHNGTPAQREALAAEFDCLEWQDVPCELPSYQGLAIKEAIRQLRLPRVCRVAESAALAPYALLGIECRYSNGPARVYLVDEGSRTVVIASDFWPASTRRTERIENNDC